jgi:hypothetical protein
MVDKGVAVPEVVEAEAGVVEAVDGEAVMSMDLRARKAPSLPVGTRKPTKGLGRTIIDGMRGPERSLAVVSLDRQD